jgi:hypothetical protein
MLVIRGAGGVTVKVTPLLDTPPAVTTSGPELAPEGTGAAMLVALQLIGEASVPLNVTVLLPCVDPKFVPVIVTFVVSGPEAGDTFVIVGVGIVTVKGTALLAVPPTVTTTGPLVAPAGTGTTICVALQLVVVAAVPLKTTVLTPCVAPKFAPAMVTLVAAGPEPGVRLVMVGTGAAITVNDAALLVVPFTVTITGPVVAPVGTVVRMLVGLQLVGVAAMPLNATVLAPAAEPKLVPAMVTLTPT